MVYNKVEFLKHLMFLSWHFLGLIFSHEQSRRCRELNFL